MITSTIIVVLFSTLVCLLELLLFLVMILNVDMRTFLIFPFSKQVFGSITKLLIEAVLLQHSKPSILDTSDDQSLEDLERPFIENGDSSELGPKSSFRLLISHPTSTVHYFWRKFDDQHMRPIFGGPIPDSLSSATDETV